MIMGSKIAVRSLRPAWRAVLLAFFWLPAFRSFAVDGALVLSAEQIRGARIVTAPLRTEPHTGAGLITLTGHVESAERGPEPILAPCQARVVAVFSHPGDAVAAGAPILLLAGPEVAALRRSLDEATTLAGAARQRAARERTLYDEGIISKSRLELAESALALANGQLVSQRQLLGAAQFNAGGRLLLRAPHAGHVSGPAFGAGEALTTGELIATVGPVQAPLVSLDAPVVVARALRIGDELRVQSRGCTDRAVLHAIGRTVDPDTQTVALHGEVDGPSCLLPGEIITASVTPRALAVDAFPVPPAAFVRRGNGTYLFMRSAQGFLPVAVDADAANAGFARAAGLSGGMQVVVEGAALLKAEWLKRGAT